MMRLDSFCRTQGVSTTNDRLRLIRPSKFQHAKPVSFKKIAPMQGGELFRDMAWLKTHWNGVDHLFWSLLQRIYDQFESLAGCDSPKACRVLFYVSVRRIG